MTQITREYSFQLYHITQATSKTIIIVSLSHQIFRMFVCTYFALKLFVLLVIMFPMISPNLREYLLELLNVHDIIVIRVLSIPPKLKEYLLELLYVQDITVSRPLVSTVVI